MSSRYNPSKTLRFAPTLLSAAIFAATPAFAQDTTEAAGDELLEEVVVTASYRAALQRAQAMKMDSSSIVEALSAEDIGKLPDTSIAESLARLPGLAGERRDGRTSGLAVRGFKEDYVGTTLNGRELLGMGDNRGVEYDLYPTEIVSGVMVYKSPDATHLTQGVGGIVDLRTASPLDTNPTLTLNLSLEQNGMKSANPDFDDQGYRASVNWVDQFADDTLGVALTLASTSSPSQEEQFRGWGYADADYNGETVKVLGGHDSFVRSAELKRNSIAGVVEWEPNDRLQLQVDALYIDFEENKVFRGMEEGGPVWSGANYTITEVVDGLATKGFADGFHSVIRNDGESKEAKLGTLGFNLAYQLTDDWKGTVDYARSQSEKTIANIESYSGVGRAGSTTQGPGYARSWEMTSEGVMYGAHPTITGPDYTDQNLIRLAGPQAWGGGMGRPDAQDGFVNEPTFDEELDTLRLQMDGDVSWGIIDGATAGLAYSDRSKTKENKGYFLTSPDYPNDGPIPSPLGTADLSFMGLGSILAYDGLGLYKSGYYDLTDAADFEPGRAGDSYTIDETITTIYGKLDIGTEVAGMGLTGNVGLQIVSTDQSSTGFSTVVRQDDPNQPGMVELTPVSGDASYNHVLPSLNLSLEVADRQFVRTAVSKTISRARLDDLRPNQQASFQFNDDAIKNPNPQAGPWSGSAGNPELKPLEANQFDLSYENYFAEEGYVAATFFYKQLTNWHRDSSFIADFSDVYIPGYHEATDGTPPATFLGLVSAKEDGLKGLVKGIEFQANLPFNLMHDSLDGLGLVGSATFMKDKLEDGSSVPGLSDRIYQLTAYYERGGFEFRIAASHRSEFTTETRGLSLALVETVDQGGTLVDAQIGYNFAESNVGWLQGLRVTLQAQNLTNEDTVQAEDFDARQITRYQSFGANYLLGLNYSF
ncbi:TonB-dependent receptor [Simiduia agarivorans]|uniref:TonB-dependent receptor n=1 Tax=Simiduia agarivorans (strain DSM 21679 / JCM 13881 / BCRC 17597 / SA1) TaxID=1117647 RepID=K4KMK8_SIMAS|nr:TonB-dependent receptor [Simiduia agarivorans]AFU99323.1 TonB-dependent receptor [Simiduia agarivorans SA1 = DSM 21679]